MSEINFNRPISASTPFAGGVSEGQGKEKVEQGKTERQDGVQEISNGLAQLLGAVLTTTTEGTGKKGKVSDPTSLSNALTLPAADSDTDIDLAKLLSLLQMETSEEQLKLAQERIKQLKDLISARCKQQLANIQKSVEDFKKAEEKRKVALISAYAALAVAVAALAAATRAGVDMAMPAYRRGRRYLRMHGIIEMTAADMAHAAREATARLPDADAGLACSVTLAARL